MISRQDSGPPIAKDRMLRDRPSEDVQARLIASEGQRPPSSPPQPPAIPAFGSIVPQMPKKDNRQEQTSLDDSKLEDNRTNWNAFAWTAPGVHNEGEAPAPLQSDQAHTGTSNHGQERRIGEIDGRGIDAGERFNRGALRNDFRQTSPSGGYIPSDQQFYGDQPKMSNLGHIRTGRDPPPSFASPDPSPAGFRSRIFNKQSDFQRQTQNLRDTSTGSAPYRSQGTKEETPSTSPGLKIPTGPRADRIPLARGGLSARGAVARSTMMRGNHPATLTWTRPGLDKPRGPSIMNTVPPHPEYVERQRAKKEDEEEGLDSRPGTETRSQSISPARTAGLEEEAERDRKLDGDGEASALHQMESKRDLGAQSQLTENTTKAPESTKLASEVDELDVDEEYLKDERAFEEEMRLLESKRPQSPRHNAKLISLLEECNALACAAKERARTGDLDPDSHRLAGKGTLDGHVAKEGLDSAAEEDFVVITAPVKRETETPPLGSLPFLVSQSSSPGSEFDLLEDEFRDFNLNGNGILEMMNERYREQDHIDEEILNEVSENFRDWRGKVYDYVEANAISEVDPQPFDGQITPAPELLAPVPTEGRRGGRNASDLELEMALVLSARIHEEEETKRKEPCFPNLEKEAIVPPMLTPLDPDSVPFLDLNSAVDGQDVLTRMEYWLPDPDFTPDEQRTFEYFYMYYPKRFGQISKQMGGRDYRECLKHYYLTKAKEKYKEKERGKGRRGGRKTMRGGSSMRPKAMALMPLFDGADAEAPPTAVTDTGRPRRAAAPTFGDIVEGDPVTPMPKRSALALKGDGMGEMSAERSSAKRTRGSSMKERGGRRGKAATLLNTASLGISPQKVDKEPNRTKIKEPKVEPDTQPDDLEFAHVLAGMSNGPPPPLTVSASAGSSFPDGQAMPPMGTFQIQHGPSMIQQSLHQMSVVQDIPVPQRVDGTVPNSYWSVPEITDFKTYLGYFGTDWQSIAITMKSKSATMIKNYYHRETKDDKIHAQALRQLAEEANEKRSRGEDLGPLPPPSQIQKRRYDSSSHMLHSRSTVPVSDGGAIGFESSAVRPRPAQASPPQSNVLAPHGPSSSQPEQPIAASNSNAQRPLPSNVSSGALPSTGASMPRTQGTIHGPLQDEPTRSVFSAIPSTQQDVLFKAGGPQPQQDLREHRPIREMALHQDPRPGPRTSHEVMQVPHPPGQPQQHVAREVISVAAPAQNVIRDPSSSQVRLAPSHSAEADPRMPQEIRHPPPQNDDRKHFQQSTSQRQIHAEAKNGTQLYEAPESSQKNRSAVNENTRISSIISPVQDLTRPTSVPAKAAAQPPQPESRPAPPPPRRVNVMSLLNDDSAELEPKKKPVETRSAVDSISQQQNSKTSQHHPYYGQNPQSHAMREYLTDPVGPLHQHQPRHSFGHAPQQTQHQALSSQQSHEPGQPFSHMAQQRRYLDQQSHYQSSGRDSPQIPHMYPSQTSRPSFPSLQRGHAPSPPPPMSAHSRTSSYTAPSPLHQQQPQGPLQPHPQANPAIPRGPPLQDSPYTRMTPTQHLASHPRHHTAQQQQQQPAPGPPPPSQQHQYQPQQQQQPPPQHTQRESLTRSGLYETQMEVSRRENEHRSRLVHELHPQVPPQHHLHQQHQQYQDSSYHRETQAPPGPPTFARATHPAGPPQQPSVETRAQQELDRINQRRQQEQEMARMRERDRERERHFAGSPPIYEGGRYGAPSQAYYEGRR